MLIINYKGELLGNIEREIANKHEVGSYYQIYVMERKLKNATHLIEETKITEVIDLRVELVPVLFLLNANQEQLLELVKDFKLIRSIDKVKKII